MQHVSIVNNVFKSSHDEDFPTAGWDQSLRGIARPVRVSVGGSDLASSELAKMIVGFRPNQLELDACINIESLWLRLPEDLDLVALKLLRTDIPTLTLPMAKWEGTLKGAVLSECRLGKDFRLSTLAAVRGLLYFELTGGQCEGWLGDLEFRNWTSLEELALDFRSLPEGFAGGLDDPRHMLTMSDASVSLPANAPDKTKVIDWLAKLVELDTLRHLLIHNVPAADLTSISQLKSKRALTSLTLCVEGEASEDDWRAHIELARLKAHFVSVHRRSATDATDKLVRTHWPHAQVSLERHPRFS